MREITKERSRFFQELSLVISQFLKNQGSPVLKGHPIWNECEILGY
jgi:hypothetical protein